MHVHAHLAAARPSCGRSFARTHQGTSSIRHLLSRCSRPALDAPCCCAVFHKYNLVLRASGNGPDFIKAACRETCLGNTYTTTL
jgi:hypothetical protein